MRKITTELVRDYKRYLFNEEKAEATIKKYVSDVEAFAKWSCGREVEKMLVLEYKQSLIESYSARSVNSALSSLNSFFSFSNWCDCKVRTLKIQQQLFANEEKELTKAEYVRLLMAAKKKGYKQLYLLMQTICSTGIRVSELKYITVKSIYDKKANIDLKGKVRVIILPDSLCKMLLKYAKKKNITKGSIFVSKNKKPLDRSNIWRMMKSVCELAKVKEEKVFPHNLRHLFARTFYKVQKDVVRLADILGHSNVNTTRIYTVETAMTHRRQIQNLGLLIC